MTREKTPVEVLNGLDFRDKTLSIVKGVGGYGLQVSVADASGFMAIARCDNADKLGRWALDRGAREVRHDYDLTSKALMVAAGIVVALLMACGPPLAPSLPSLHPGSTADAGVNVTEPSGYTLCDRKEEGNDRCDVKVGVIVHCGKYLYDGHLYWVWTTDGAWCR